MAGKNKHKRRGGGHSHQSSNNNYTPKLSQDQLTNLVTEATQMHTLLNQRHEKLKQSKDFVYILSTKWLRQWKDYVGYEEMFSDDKDAHSKKRGKKRPGPPNTDLISNNKSFLQIPEQLQEYQYLNIVINEKLDIGDDFIGVTEAIWQQFNQIYGPGIQIKRSFRITKSKAVSIDAKPMKCDFIFINYNDEQFINKIQHCKMTKTSIQNIIPYYNIQMNNIWGLENLYKYLEDICLVKFNSDKVTLWLNQNFIGTYSIQEKFVKSAKQKSYEMFAQKLEIQDPKYEDLDLDDFLKQQYTILVQIGDSKIVSADFTGEQLHGYCEQCVQKKNLKYNCLCQHKFYCSKQCQVNDQVFHFNSCSQAFKNLDDDAYNKKKVNHVSQVSRCGLKNLGNTCYMNSSLQAFICFDFLVDYFSCNKFKQAISQKQKNADMFLQNISKFCKKMGEETEMNYFQPWDIKGQINYFLTPFKGYKQHDAIDFFQGFLNTINDCLQKSENEAYNELFKKNLLGDFDSLVICPDCNNQVKNFQCFTQLTLPIKAKTKKILFNYALFDNPFVCQYGKAQVKQKWSQIKSDLGIDNDCIIYGGLEVESGLTHIQFDTNPQAFFKKFKKQLLCYPYQKLAHNEILFNANFITIKTICGQNTRANLGYPFPVKANRTKTLGHFFIDLIRRLNLDKNPQLLQQLQIKYEQIIKKIQETKKMQQVQSSQTAQIKQQKTEIKKQKQEKTSSNKKQKQSNGKKGKQQKKKEAVNQKQKQKQNQKQQQDFNKQLQNLNTQLNLVLQTENLKVFIQDTRKIRNICFFCKRRCDGCYLEPDFRASIEDTLAMKIDQLKLFINITPKPQPVKNRHDLSSTGEPTLKDCLTLFTQPEMLDQQNAWYCPQCQDMRLALKQLHISRFPKYLILQLSRFKNGQNGKIKNSQPILYNEYEEFGGQKYRLLSVIVHEGSIQAGHYWAICRRANDFYIFNDDKVSKTDKICNKNAYILCYKRQQKQKDKMEQKSKKKHNQKQKYRQKQQQQQKQQANGNKKQ